MRTVIFHISSPRNISFNYYDEIEVEDDMTESELEDYLQEWVWENIEAWIEE